MSQILRKDRNYWIFRVLIDETIGESNYAKKKPRKIEPQRESFECKGLKGAEKPRGKGGSENVVLFHKAVSQARNGASSTETV